MVSSDWAGRRFRRRGVFTFKFAELFISFLFLGGHVEKGGLKVFFLSCLFVCVFLSMIPR